MNLFGFYISRTPPAKAPEPLPLQVLTVTQTPDSVHNFITPGGETVVLKKLAFEVHMEAVVATRAELPDGRIRELLAGDELRIDINQFLPPKHAERGAELQGAYEPDLLKAWDGSYPKLVRADAGLGDPAPPCSGTPLRYVHPVEYHTRTLTLVAQKTVQGDDVFVPLVNAALAEFVAEGRKDSFDPDPAKRPKAGMGGAKGSFTAWNGVRIDWVASELELPEGPGHV